MKGKALSAVNLPLRRSSLNPFPINHFRTLFVATEVSHPGCTATSHGSPATSFSLASSLTTVNLQPLAASRPARWTDWHLRAIILIRHYRSRWRLSLRRGNEHFSKRTKPAGVLPLRIHGHTTVDRRAVWRRHCRPGRDWHCPLFHPLPAKPEPRQTAAPEHKSLPPARPDESSKPRRPLWKPTTPTSSADWAPRTS